MFSPTTFRILVLSLVLPGLLAAMGCQSTPQASQTQPTHAVYTPEDPDVRAAIAERDRNAYAQPILAVLQQLQIWSVALSDDPRANADLHLDESPHHDWLAEARLAALFSEYLTDVLQGLGRGEVLSEDEFKALRALEQNLARTNDMRLVPHYGPNRREAQLALQGRVPTPGVRSSALQMRTPQQYSLEEASNALTALSMVYQMRAQRNSSSVAPAYWRSLAVDFDQMAKFLRGQAIQMASRQPGEPAWSTVRTAHGLRIGFLGRYLVSRNYEFADYDAMSSLVTSWSPEQHRMMRGRGNGDIYAAVLYMAWLFDVEADSEIVPPQEIIFGAMPSWMIAREVLPNALRGTTIPNLEARGARILELNSQRVSAAN